MRSGQEVGLWKCSRLHVRSQAAHSSLKWCMGGQRERSVLGKVLVPVLVLVLVLHTQCQSTLIPPRRLLPAWIGLPSEA